METDNTIKVFEPGELKPAEGQIIFFSPVPNGEEEVLRISKEGFFYRGERVDDVHDVYTRFHEWLKTHEVHQED